MTISLIVKFVVKNKLMADFLRYLFEELPSGALKVTQQNNLGRQLVAYVSRSLVPMPSPSKGKNGIIFNLSLPNSRDLRVLDNHFLYYTEDSLLFLEKVLKAEFENDFRGYIRAGKQRDMKVSDIVEAYIISRHLSDPNAFDTLKKREYRLAIEDLKEKKNYLFRKAYYLEECISTDGLPPKKTQD